MEEYFGPALRKTLAVEFCFFLLIKSHTVHGRNMSVKQIIQNFEPNYLRHSLKTHNMCFLRTYQ